IKNNQIEPGSIVLEVTESALMNETSESLDILNRLRMKGFSLSIDDFGTGYSSLVKLYQAPFSELKIDQHFIMHMAADPDAAAIVRICILLARELKMHTVAEGVETEAIWNQLKELGCDIAQGSFITKPMPTEDFILWVKNWKMEHT
ncbi:MAG: EAL domain-containing protein, partial [Methylococcales bacterium]|nr:EAL domain-containing protein [Methylococcales bacterium]